MTAQLFLISPKAAEPRAFATALGPVVTNAKITTLFLTRHERDAQAYRALLDAVLPIAQAAGCAVLVENDAALARETGADGIHVTGDIEAVRKAIAVAKPGLIVGAGPVRTRHEAMTIGELDIDYLFFGNLAAPARPEARDLAAWWVETFEVPAVLSGEIGGDAAGGEFLALGESLWNGTEPPEALIARAVKSLETA